MFQKERYEQIYSILQERQSATVRYLQNSLHVSEATVRRDLSEMENLGLLQRVWGGAMLQTTADKDPPAFVRVKANNEKKGKDCVDCLPDFKGVSFHIYRWQHNSYASCTVLCQV